MRTYLSVWFATFVRGRWGELENPNWIQSTLLYPEDVKSWRHGFWQLLMVAAEWAERLSTHVQDRYNDAGGGEWYRMFPAYAITEEANDERRAG